MFMSKLLRSLKKELNHTSISTHTALSIHQIHTLPLLKFTSLGNDHCLYYHEKDIIDVTYTNRGKSIFVRYFSVRKTSHKCRVSQEECARLREGVPYVKVYRYNPKHLYPKLNGYGDNGQRSLKL